MKLLAIGVIIILLITACSTYNPSYESVTDDERAYVEKAITSLFEGAEAAKPYLTEEYYNELTEEGYWDEIKKYELSKLEISDAYKKDGQLVARCSITYITSDSRRSVEKERVVFFYEREGKFLIGDA